MALKLVRLHHPHVEKVDFVVSNKKKITHHIVNEFRDEIRNLMDPEDREIMGEVLPGDPIDRLPLQAADLICWHQQRMLAKKLTKVDLGHVRRLKCPAARHEWKLAGLERIAEKFNLVGN